MEAAKTAQGLIAFARSLLGKPYMYGNNGWIITQWLIDTTARAYPAQYRDTQTDINKYGMTKRQYLATKIGKPGYDCSSITDIYTGTDRSANGWLAAGVRSGTIDTMPDTPGLTVHYNGHMGIYIGNGDVIEARGTFYGIVQTRLSDRPWRSWAQVPGISYEKGEQEIMLQKGDKGEAVTTWQTCLVSASVPMINPETGKVYGIDGSYGEATENGTRTFQEQQQLPVTGIVNGDTYTAMLRVLLDNQKNLLQENQAATSKLILISDIING